MKIFEWLDDWKNSIVEGITSPITGIQTWFAEKLAEGMILMMEKVEPESLALIKDASVKLAANPDMPPEIRKIFAGVTETKAPAWFALAPVIAAILAYPAASAAFSGKIQEISQASNAMFTPAILSPGETIAAFRRGLKDVTWKNQELAWAGYDIERIAALEAITEFYPAPQDFIRFAVRDTFNEAVVTQYKYDQDYPSNIDAYVKKIGMSPEWMKHFWRAHWELPSPTQMYEMLHRGKITMQDAKNLLRIADIAPYFIDPMLAISYNPYTRVDIRRMWDSGVLSREEVKRSYMDGGYDDEHAEKLTAWTVAEGMKEEADLTKAEIKAALVAGEIAEGDAVEAFKKLGYDDRESEIIVNLALYAQEKALRNREKNIYVKQYVKNLITFAELEKGLDTLGLSEREKKITIAEAKLQVKESV